MSKSIKTYQPDTLNDLQNTDLVKLSRDLLGSIVDSTNILTSAEMNPKKLQEAKVVLGFLNATVNAVKAKMQYFRMVGLGDKIKAVKKASAKVS